MSNVHIQEWAKQAKEALSVVDLAIDQIVEASYKKAVTVSHRDRMVARKQDILQMIQETPGINSFVIQKKLGIKATSIRYMIKGLELEGLVKGEGERRSRTYFPIEA